MEIYFAVAASVASVLGAAAAVAQLWASTKRRPTERSLAEQIRAARARELQVLLRDQQAYIDLRLRVKWQSPDFKQRAPMSGLNILSSQLPDIMMKAGGTIVVFGAPGSGKSLILRKSTDQIFGDATCSRIFEFFSIRGWSSGRRQGLEVWISEQLASRWQVSSDYVTELLRTGRLVPIIEDADQVEGEQIPTIVEQLNELSVTCKGIVVAVPGDSRIDAWSSLSRVVTLEVQPLNAAEQKKLILSLARDPDPWEDVRRAHGKRGGNLSWMFQSPLWLSAALRGIDDPEVLGHVSDEPQVKHYLVSSWIRRAHDRGRNLSVAGTPKGGVLLTWRWLSTIARMANRFPAKEFSGTIAMICAVEGASKTTILLSGLVPILVVLSYGHPYFSAWELALLIGGTTYIGQRFVSQIGIQRYYRAKSARLEASFFVLELAAGLTMLSVSATILIWRGSDLPTAIGFGVWVAAMSCWKRWIGSFFAHGWIRKRALLPSRLRAFLRWCASPEIQLMIPVNGAYSFAHIDLLDALVRYDSPLESLAELSERGT